MIIKAILDSIKEDCPIRSVTSGARFNAVMSKNCGLSSRLMRESLPERSFQLNGLSARELAGWSLSSEIEKSSLGMAALNSLIDVDEKNCTGQNASEIIEEYGRNKNISIIGHFPFTDSLRTCAKNLWVMEKNKKPGDFSAEDAEKYLPLSDVVALSGTTFINHTIEKLLNLCPEESIVLVLGGSTPITPVLFDFGIDFISGCKVLNIKQAMELVDAGATFKEIKKSGSVHLLTMIKQKISTVK